MENKIEISTNEVSQRIYTIRGCRVMLDSDLAEIYNVQTKRLNEAVKRNIERFPCDFMFELTSEECENLRCQIGTSNVENCFKVDARPILRSQTVISSVGNSLEPDIEPRILRSQIATSSVENSLEPDIKPILRSKFDTSSLASAFRQHGGNRYAPFAFTEPGVAMLSSVLHSPRAIQVNIEIMRVFIQLRKQLKTQQLDWVPKYEALETRVRQLESKIPLNPPFSKGEVLSPVRRIQNIVAGHWGLKAEDLKSDARTKTISLARQIAVYLVRKQMQLSFSEIGGHFGERDHSSILHSYRKIETISDANNAIRETLNFLASEIRLPHAIQYQS